MEKRRIYSTRNLKPRNLNKSLKRYGKMFGPDYMLGTHWREAKAMRLEGLESWFRTPTGKALAQKLAREMGLFNWPG